MTKQELLQVIGALNQLANNNNGNYVRKSDILEAIHNDNFKTSMLSLLASNNIPYTLCCISTETMQLAYRIYRFDDYEDSEEEYLKKTLRALNGFKLEVQRILEYIDLLKQTKALDNSMDKYSEGILEGVHMYDYKCSLDNIKY